MAIDPELMQLFVSEAREQLDQIESKLVELSQSGCSGFEANIDNINILFRSFHSLKGSAGSLTLKYIAKITHDAETLLDHYRVTKSDILPNHVDIFLTMADFIRAAVDTIEKTQSEDGLEAVFKTIEEELVREINKLSGKNQPQKMRLSGAADKISKPADSLEAPKVNEIKKNEDVKNDAELNNLSPLVQKFIHEETELLEHIESILLEINNSPDNHSDEISEIMRCLHSFKGNCGFLGFSSLERLSHKTETACEEWKTAKNVPPEGVLTLLMVIDSLRNGVLDINNGGFGDINGFDQMMALLDTNFPNPSSFENQNEKTLGEIPTTQNEISEKNDHKAFDKEDQKVEALSADKAFTNPKTLEKAFEIQALQKKEPPSKPISRKDIRVDLAKLDTLLNLVGELVIAEAMVTRNPDLEGLELENFDRAVHHIRRVTNELQDIVMSVRMIPLSSTFQKILRVVHDLSKKLDKKVKFESAGEETEVDKTVIELIADPLTHIARNSIDHGIESSKERIAAGKPETGFFRIEAHHESGEVWITISDDGRGLDREKILAKGIERGLVIGDGSGLSDENVFKLIFEAGFSTAEKVTEISGRGVGMDVVKRNTEKLKGRVTVKSKRGMGTTVIIRIPLTLAIIEGMLVKVGKGLYTVPLLSIRESFRPNGNNIIRTPDNREVVRIREAIVPTLKLFELFNQTPLHSTISECILILVEDQGKCIALMVDEILGQQRTVIKALPTYLKSVKCVSGCTILGDGSVSLILDVGSIVESFGEHFSI